MLVQAVLDEGEVPRDSLEGTDGSKRDQVQSSNDRPHSGGNTSERAEGGLNLQVLHNTYTLLSQQVLDLQKAKDAQTAEILKLKTRIKKLEKKCKPSISHHRAWLRSVSRLSRTKKLGKMESVSKQGRKNAKPGPTLDAFDDLDADLAHGMDYMEIEEAVKEGRQSNETEELNLDADTEVIVEDKGSGKKGVNTVSTARPDIDTARPEVHTANAPVSIADPEVSAVELRTPPTTTSIFDDEDITMAQTLIKMKEEKAKEKGVAFKDVEDSSRHLRSITTLKPLPYIDPKDKGKGILVEEEPVTIKRKDQGIDQIKIDEELAHKLHEEELAEIARIQEEKAAQEEVSRTAIMEMINEVQAAGEDTSKKKEVLKEPGSTKVEVKQKEVEKSTRKRSGTVLKMKARKKARKQTHADSDASKKREGSPRMKRMSKRKKTESDLKKEEDLKTFLKIVPDKEGIIYYEVLEKRFQIINWESKFYHYDIHGAEGIYYMIFGSDGSSRWIKTFSEMVTRFDRLDLVELYNLVMQRFETITPLRTVFDANAEDELWQNQERWNLKS
ncbi:hypothetical protein Tco_1041886 [Tanacetum coccineum]|uniref:Uncharacterized protein n=1 Tax=Tanacetum coccineum TaxID=301880 RepID=A0ABQ5GIZ0_9ASTR